MTANGLSEQYDTMRVENEIQTVTVKTMNGTKDTPFSEYTILVQLLALW